MTRKKLPRAIARLAAELHEADADEVVSEEPKPKAPRRARAKSRKREAAADASSMPATTTEAEPLTGEVIAPQSGEGVSQESRRKAAEDIVFRYSGLALLGGLVPLPAASVAALTALNMRLVKALSELYGLPFERNQTRSIILGLIGGAVPTGLGAAAGSMVGLVVPAGAVLGLAVSSLTGAALTRNIGRLFIEHFESGGAPVHAAAPVTSE